MGRVTAEPRSRTPAPGRFARRPRVRVGAIVAVALVVAFVVWLFVRGGESSSPKTAPERAGAVPATPAVLGALARVTGSRVYWAGPRAGETYELTKTADGRVYVRYLPRGVAVGAAEPYLTVGTYPVAHAYPVTRSLASESGAIRVSVPGGGIGFYDSSTPDNVYVAFPGVNEQIEVFDPVAGEARRLVLAGQITPVSTAGGSGSAATAASLAQLQALPRTVGHAVYWAGAQSGVTYELTRAPGGHVFVRYLPPGATIGTNHPYLTVGTYPIAGAFALTKKLAQASTAVRVDPGGGGVAFYARTRPTNVYVAYPGTDLQIEVYDPSAGAARLLVAAGRIVPVG